MQSTRTGTPALLSWALGIPLACGLCLVAAGRHDESAQAPTATLEFRLAHENVLGTSLDLIVRAPDRAEAGRCEQAVLREIDRLERIFSTYDPRSEISRINASPWQPGETIAISAELGRLLATCASWQARTNGTLNVYLGETIGLWRRAAAKGSPPLPAAIAGQVPRHRQGGFQTVERDGKPFLERHGPGRFDVDAVAKGYIIDRALAAARRAVPSLRGLLLDLGGDIRTWRAANTDGDKTWEVGIADPQDPADNAPPLTRVRLENRAIATSGGYGRPLIVGDRRLAPILDPRTGRPVHRRRSATVVAADAATADALATALCVLDPSEGLALVERTPDAAGLILDNDGIPHRSRGWKTIEVSEPDAARSESAWPEGYRLTVCFELRNASEEEPRGRKRKKFKRHYVAAWVEDAKNRPVRLLALWAHRGEFKYVKDLKAFWKRKPGLGTDKSLRAVSRATRPPGAYTLTWDGRDQDGKPLPPGTYSIHIDINREDGPPRGRAYNSHTTVEIACGGRKAQATGRDKPELGGVKVTYGPADGEAPPGKQRP